MADAIPNETGSHNGEKAEVVTNGKTCYERAAEIENVDIGHQDHAPESLCGIQNATSPEHGGNIVSSDSNQRILNEVVDAELQNGSEQVDDFSQNGISQTDTEVGVNNDNIDNIHDKNDSFTENGEKFANNLSGREQRVEPARNVGFNGGNSSKDYERKEENIQSNADKQASVDSQPIVRPKEIAKGKSDGGEWRDREDPYGSAAGSLPLHGTVIREGDMVSFIADNLEEKIRQSFSSQKYSDLSKKVVQQKSPQDASAIPKIDPTALDDLEKQARKVADNLDLMLGNLKGTLHNMSAISVGYIQTHRDAVDRMGESVDNSVKSMYSLIAKCEELNKNMQPVYQLSRQIKEIKRRLDLLETQFK
ncbi:uncharacterized protein LOC144437184 isoform X1 [Glandiceps talaboti]